MWSGEAELVSAVDGCFSLVEREVVVTQASVKVVESRGHKVAVFRGKSQADIIDDSSAYSCRELSAVFHQNERKGDNKQEGAERVALRNSLLQSIADGVVDVEGGQRVGSKVHTGSVVIEETEPRGQSGAINILYSIPDVFAQNVVKRFF